MRDTATQKMSRSGTLVEWNDARGFGWLRPDVGGDKVFVHISALQPKPAADQRPQLGWKLEYQLEVQGGKLRAKDVRWTGKAVASASATGTPKPMPARGDQPQRRVPSKKTNSSSATSAVLLTCLGALALAVPLAIWFFAGRGDAALWYAGASVLTFVMYWVDKNAAQRGAWRVPEARLHVLSMAGGWPGALLAQHALRHKNQKRSFQVAFVISVVLNGLGLWAWLRGLTF